MPGHPTQNLLREMKLDGMAEAFAELQTQDAAADLSHAEWLGLLIDREATNRTTKHFQTRMKAGKLRHVGAAIEDVDYKTPGKLDKALFQLLAAGRWIAEKRNLLITGPVRNCLSDQWRSNGSPLAKPGSPAPSVKRPAATAQLSSISGYPGRSQSWNSPMGMGASRVCSGN